MKFLEVSGPFVGVVPSHLIDFKLILVVGNFHRVGVVDMVSILFVEGGGVSHGCNSSIKLFEAVSDGLDNS